MSFGLCPKNLANTDYTPDLAIVCFVILADILHQFGKAFSPRPVPHHAPLTSGDDQVGKQAGKGSEQCKVPCKSTRPMVPEHLVGAEGSDQEFTALEKGNRDACNPRGATAHAGLQRVGLLLARKPRELLDPIFPYTREKVLKQSIFSLLARTQKGCVWTELLKPALTLRIL